MPKDPIAAVIFDMDGTITQPVIDWQQLRQRIGAPPERPIMDHIRALPEPDQSEATTILLETEWAATDQVPLNVGFTELYKEIRDLGLKTAVVTNNHGAALQNVLTQHGLTFDVALSRDDGELKPAPDLILLALNRLGCHPEQAIGIGDSRLDVESCQQADVRCIYLTHGTPKFPHTPSVANLADARKHLSLT